MSAADWMSVGEPGLFALVAAAGRAAPERAAIRFEDESVSYRDLLDTASWLAERLRAVGVDRGDVVAVCAGTPTGYLVAVMAVLAADAVFLPVDPDLPPGRVATVLREAAPAAVLRTSDFLRESGPLDSTPAPVVELPTSPVRPPVGERPAARAVAHGEEPAYLLYTSGSTGTPKGVLCHHRGLINLLTDFSARETLEPGAVGTMWAAVGFDVSVFEIFSVWLVGGTVLGIPADVRLEPEPLFALLAREEVAHAYLPTVLLPALRTWAEAHPGELRLRRMMVGVEPIPERLLRDIAAAVPGLTIINAYGPTETHVIATAYDIRRDDPEPDGGRTPIGAAVDGVTTYLLDPDDEPVADGEVGELWIGGVQVALGYHRRPDLTVERFRPDPFRGTAGARRYRTGDLARRRPDGNLVYCGRIDRQVKLRGFRVELAEVEAVLERHPGVGAAVIVQPESASDALCGYVMGTATPAELLAHAADLLPPYMVPSWVVVVDVFPLTGNEKVDRAALARRSPPVAAPGDEAPRTDTETVLARLWAEVLGLSRVDLTADFATLGGHSLAAVRLCGRIRRDFGVEVTVADVYRWRTVRAVAEAVEGRSGTPTRSLSERPSRRIGPLSAAQQALSLLLQLYPDCQAYTLPVLHRITGNLDVAALTRALELVVGRHAALRTVIATVAGRQVQRVVDSVSVDLPVVPVSEVELAGRCAAETTQAGCDLAGGTLFRAVLFQLGPERHALLLLAHHIVTDGWSFNVLQRDLGLAYTAVRDGAAPAWAPLPAQFIDLAAEQAAPDSARTVASELDFWRRELATIPPPLRLPGQRPRPPRPRFRAGRVTAPLPPATTASVRELAQRLHTTVFTVLVTGVQLILARYAERAEFLLGMPVAGRDAPHAEDLVGFFNNSLVLRCEVAATATAADLVAATHQRLMAALAHPHVPFDVLVREVNAPRVPGANPLFQIWCNMLSYPPAPLRLAGCAVEPRPAPPAGALFDLTWYFVEDGGDLSVEIVYDVDLFDEAQVSAMVGHFRTLLPLVAQEPETVHTDLDFGTADPGRETGGFVAPGLGVAERFRRAAERHGDAPAIGDTQTYADLAATVTDLAAKWQGTGPVGILAARTPALAAGVLAALTAGVPFVLFDAAQPPPRLRRMISQVQLGSWWDATDGHHPTAPQQAPAVGADDLTDGAPVPADAGYVTFTSGTTGEPAAITSAAEPLQAFLQWYEPEFGLTRDDRFVLLSGVGHDPLLRDLLTPLCIGARLFVPPRAATESQVEMVRWLAAVAPTVLHLTPAMARLLAAAAVAEGVRLASVRLVGFGGAAMTRAGLADARTLFPQARLLSYYGTTETPQVVGVAEAGTEGVIGSGSPTARLSVVTPTGGPAPVNGTGEIVVRSPYLALGYLTDPARTARQFRTRDGAREYRTGDLGWRRPDGSVVLTGRADRQLTVNGLRVEPAELESVARDHPQVKDCVVIAMVRSATTEVVAFVVGDPRSLAGEAVLRHFAERLPATMVPTRVVALPELPLNPNGKPDLTRLAELAETADGSGFPRQTGDTALVAAITQAWRTVLHAAEAPPPDANFFDCGGTSASLLMVQTELTCRLSREVTLVDLFRYPTIASLAAALADAEAAPVREAR